ncbi:MAG: tRNA 2-selenouridine(34) synthase MnmH, partial [bacterium]
MDISAGEIEDLNDPLIVDVRSPGEYREDHLPTAINLPVLNDAERDRIGTIYHQESEFKARREGAKTICSNVPALIEALEETVGSDDPILLYCWRGGQRSQSLATILNRVGYNVYRLEGGYKAYRSRVNDFFQNADWDEPIVTLFGLTGAGKTTLLDHLDQQGASTVDLEGAANHRGSAFGGIGLGDQPSQKAFERRLYEELRTASGPIYIEGESRKIGKRTIPDSLFEHLKKPPRVWVETDIDRRVTTIRNTYPWQDCEDTLCESIEDLRERLGGTRTDRLKAKLRDGELNFVIRTLLEQYYDPAYRKSSP